MAHPLANVNWEIQPQPIMSGLTTAESWCKLTLYNPAVVKRGNEYLMWYIGNSTRTRQSDHAMGMARSTDGIHFEPYADNPVFTGDDISFGTSVQTPHVIWDDDAGLFRMWFSSVSGELGDNGMLKTVIQHMGYATSEDGVKWDVHPEVLWSRIRSPYVLRDGDGYAMWSGSAPSQNAEDFTDIVTHIYRFTSDDGLTWRRDEEPCLTPGGEIESTVYPCVHRDDDGYVMWYGGHKRGVKGGLFQIYVSTSQDGITWTHNQDAPAIPASQNPNRYDGRYTSTPKFIDDGDRLLMYFCTRDLGCLYGAGDGTVQADGMGIYRHIGVAIGEKP